jgi:ABC-2 type transport system ATP-binding protein
LDVLYNDVSPHRVLVVDLEAQQPALTDLPGVVSVEVSNGGLRQALAFRRDETDGGLTVHIRIPTQR